MAFYVKEYIRNGVSDSETIRRCMSEAKKTSGMKTVVFDGKDYLLDEAILVPNDVEIIIDSCNIKQNDFVGDNIFRGDNVTIDEKDTTHILDVVPIQNIKIIGKNGAKLIGPDRPMSGYHSVLQEEQKMVGDFWGYLTHMISFSLCKNIEICGLSLTQTMGWAISFDSCEFVRVHDIDIRSNVKNGDGINFRSGCHDCIAENISGYTSDDTVACTALSNSKKKRVSNRQLSGDQ